MTTIYGLRDPRDGKIRYVGRTRMPRSRLIGHRSAGNGPTAKWSLELRSLSLDPEMVVLEQCDGTRAAETEAKWIATYSASGLLLNRAARTAPRGTDILELAEHMLQARVSPEQRRLFTKAAELQGLDLSSLVRRLLTLEVDRLRSEGKKL